MIEEHINARLKATAAVTAIVGDRIYPSHIPQRATLPAVSHLRLSGMPEHAMGADADVRQTRVQVSCWSSQYSQGKTLAAAVRGALSRYAGTIGDDEILDVYEENELDDYDPPTAVHQIVVDLLVWYRE